MRIASIVAIQSKALGALVVAALAVSCATDERLPNYQMERNSRSPRTVEACSVPTEGCPCDNPGTLVDCGEIHSRVDEYIACVEGVRLCSDDGLWGACAGDLVVVKGVTARNGETSLALGAPASCADTNPCDPLCRQIADTGTGLKQLDEGLCSTAGGVELCPLCGYAGPVADLPYASIPSAWQRIPANCNPSDDHCPLDMQCVGSTCQVRRAPCASSDVTCATDLTLGKPCFDPTNPNATYHVPLCNRGADALDSGTVRIGVDTRGDAMAVCVPVAGAGELGSDFPNSGSIAIELSPNRRIAPGECIDVNPSNSQSSGLDLSGNRSWVVNYDASLNECKACNNAALTVASSDTNGASTCTTCVNLECNQLDPATTLRGVVYDPGGRHPLPNVQVYVPNGTVAPFIDGVSCDTCDTAVSGSPLTWTTTDATGHFALSNVPSGVSFPLVVQLGRWRRQLSIPALDVGQTRWITYCSRSRGTCALTTDELEPIPWYDTSRRLRIPATQRRCNAWGCTGEGDIPAIAAILGDADPLECTLRRIGIADSEFGAPGGDRRVHLYSTASGMRSALAGAGYGASGLLAGNAAAPLGKYSMLLAGCNEVRDSIEGAPYRDSPYASGPSFNGWPSPRLLAEERVAVRNFANAGGRVVTTHFQSMDLVYLNFNPPAHARFAEGADANPLVSPYDPTTLPAFNQAVTDYARHVTAFDWVKANASEYSPGSPAVYLFGNNVANAGNALHQFVQPSTRLPSLSYDIDVQTALGRTFAAWAEASAATAPAEAQRLKWSDWSPMVSDIHPQTGAVALLRGNSLDASRFDTPGPLASRPTPLVASPCLQGDGSAYDCALDPTWGDSHVGLYQFDTPLETEPKCGRVAVASGHVSQHDCVSPSGVRQSSYCGNIPPYSEFNPAPDCACFDFPSQANTACGVASSPMTPEELAFEFAFFSASQCVGELRAPTRPAKLASGVFVRDFEANCRAGEQAVWQLFSWQAAVPDGAAIRFYVATADAESALAAAPYALLGIADRSTTTWTSTNHTVDTIFREQLEPPDVSRRWLRMKAVFVPNGSVSPTLSEWRAVFNCIPNE